MSTLTATKYKVVNGTSYRTETPNEVVLILESARTTKQRIRIFYGDAVTGRDWLEEYDVIGTVGRSTGGTKVPLLIARSTSVGGGAILDGNVIRILAQHYHNNWKEVYRHEKYHLPTLHVVYNTKYPERPWEVTADNATQARFTTEIRAKRYMYFINGTNQAK